MELKFRDLRADEIECRVAMATAKGVSLLLYKNARCDMNILDETVGNLNWQRGHEEHKGNLFCSILINRHFQNPEAQPDWVSKADCGTESNTEKEKGEASDSFKRAGFNWGIGRELYTAPFIWIPADFCNIMTVDSKPKPKFKCNNKFEVTKIRIENKVITGIEILNTTFEVNGRTHPKVVWSWGFDKKPDNPAPVVQNTNPHPEVKCPVCGKTILAQSIKGAKRTPEEIVSNLGMCVECYRSKNDK